MWQSIKRKQSIQIKYKSKKYFLTSLKEHPPPPTPNTTQHNTTQHNTTQHNTTQHNTTQHNTTQHNTTQHNTTQHNTTQHNTTQHNTHTHTHTHTCIQTERDTEFTWLVPINIRCILVLFVLRFYGPVNPMESCWVQSVKLLNNTFTGQA